MPINRTVDPRAPATEWRSPVYDCSTPPRCFSALAVRLRRRRLPARRVVAEGVTVDLDGGRASDPAPERFAHGHAAN